jgi:hypothetical protein
MKVIDTSENMMNQEPQDFLEEQLIEVMTMQMHMIQFGSISNSLQT